VGGISAFHSWGGLKYVDGTGPCKKAIKGAMHLEKRTIISSVTAP